MSADTQTGMRMLSVILALATIFMGAQSILKPQQQQIDTLKESILHIREEIKEDIVDVNKVMSADNAAKKITIENMALRDGKVLANHASVIALKDRIKIQLDNTNKSFEEHKFNHLELVSALNQAKEKITKLEGSVIALERRVYGRHIIEEKDSIK